MTAMIPVPSLQINNEWHTMLIKIVQKGIKMKKLQNLNQIFERS